jgi:hypothetical protein
MAWLHFTGDLPLGDLLVAVGTLLLAGFTWRLAQQTKADVALTRQSVEAIDMPFVIATAIPTAGTIQFHRAGSAVYTETGLQVRLWNLGQGPAIVTNASLKLDGAEVMHPWPNSVPVGHGQAADPYLVAALQHDEKAPDPFFDDEREGVFVIDYSHASGSTYQTVSRMRVGRAARCRCSTSLAGLAEARGACRGGPAERLPTS